jgi:hypothetical protein
VYTIDRSALVQGKSDFLDPEVNYTTLTYETGTKVALDIMQGGEFSDDGFLYLIHGYGSDIGEGYGYGIKVFDITTWKLVVASTNEGGTGGFKYEFHPTTWDTWKYQEPEGLTYWDLDKDTRAPHIQGQLHAIMLDNDYVEPDAPGNVDDELYFKHYRIL